MTTSILERALSKSAARANACAVQFAPVASESDFAIFVTYAFRSAPSLKSRFGAKIATVSAWQSAGMAAMIKVDAIVRNIMIIPYLIAESQSP